MAQKRRGKGPKSAAKAKKKGPKSAAKPKCLSGKKLNPDESFVI